MELVKNMKRLNCHDCGANPGELHDLGCDTERCPECGGQIISCGCFNADKEGNWDFEKLDKYEREKWTGIMYEEAHLYAEEHDLWVYWDEEKGWAKCDRNHPDSRQDLNTSVVAIMDNWKPRLKK
jgi:hypothetical protein